MPPYVLATATPESTVAPSTTTLDPGAGATPSAVAPSPAQPTTVAEDEDWETLVRRALLAEELLVYSDSARALTSFANMVGAYPGLDATGRVMSGAELCAVVADDVASGEPQVDLVLTSGAACVQSLVQAGGLLPYLPVDLLPSLPEDMLEPVLTHHWEVLGIHHNDRLGEGQAIDSWWDLVSPAWRGSVALADPLVDERAQGLLDALVAHEAELRASYRGELGDGALDEEPAWAVWLRALVANDVRSAISQLRRDGLASAARSIGSGCRAAICGCGLSRALRPSAVCGGASLWRRWLARATQPAQGLR